MWVVKSICGEFEFMCLQIVGLFHLSKTMFSSEELPKCRMDLPSLPFHLIKQLWSFLNKGMFEKLLNIYPEWLRCMDFEVYCFEERKVSLDNEAVRFPDVFCKWSADAWQPVQFESIRWPSGGNVTTLAFYAKSLKELPVDFVFPQTVESLFIRVDNCGSLIGQDALPRGLKNLDICGHVKLFKDDVVLPTGLERLSLGASSLGLQPLSLLAKDATFDFATMSPFLKQLVLHENFNQSLVPGMLPQTITNLTLSGKFNQPLVSGALPSRLEFLQFGHCFDHPIPVGVLPPTLTTLILGEAFNQPFLPFALPQGLCVLTFGSCFNQPLDGILPDSLEELVLGYNFDQPIRSTTLPRGLKNLHFGTKFD